nr:hypothetical protein [candidate division Zixibacteria bacterium]
MGKLILKILLAIVLISIIAGLSVYKSHLSAKREQADREALKEEYFQTRDSIILRQFDDSTRVYIDSIQYLEKFYQDRIDSLNTFYTAQESVLTSRIQEQEEALKKKNNISTPSTVRPQKQDDTHERIRDDYDRRINDLPGDLTRYELRVSIDEIIIELSEKYKISPDSVRQILKK